MFAAARVTGETGSAVADCEWCGRGDSAGNAGEFRDVQASGKPGDKAAKRRIAATLKEQFGWRPELEIFGRANLVSFGSEVLSCRSILRIGTEGCRVWGPD